MKKTLLAFTLVVLSAGSALAQNCQHSSDRPAMARVAAVARPTLAQAAADMIGGAHLRGVMRPAILLLSLSADAALSTARAADGLPTDDPTLKPYQESVATYVGRCRGDLSHVELSGCLYDQIKALRIRVKAEMKKRLADAEATAAEEPIGGVSGTERAGAEKRGVLKGQAAWENYTKVVCDETAAQFGRNGGNGGDLAQGNCMIRHLVHRYNELRH